MHLIICLVGVSNRGHMHARYILYSLYDIFNNQMSLGPFGFKFLSMSQKIFSDELGIKSCSLW